MRGLLLVALGSAVCACSKPMQLQARCVPTALDVATCDVEMEPGAELAWAAGDLAPEPIDQPATRVELRADFHTAALDANVVHLRATDRRGRRKPGVLDVPVSFPVRTREMVTTSGGTRVLHVEAPAGVSVFVGDEEVHDGTWVVDRPETLTFGMLDYSSEPTLVIRARAAGGMELTESIELDRNRDLIERTRTEIGMRGVAHAWAAESGGGTHPALVVSGDKIAGDDALALRNVQRIVFRDDGDEQVDVCGAYRRGEQYTAVTRWRNRADVEVYDARTGKKLGKKRFWGSMPRECRDREQIETIDGQAIGGTIDGGAVDAKAVDAWIASL